MDPRHSGLEGSILADYVARRASGTLPCWSWTGNRWIALYQSGTLQAWIATIQDCNWAAHIFACRTGALRGRLCKFLNITRATLYQRTR